MVTALSNTICGPICVCTTFPSVVFCPFLRACGFFYGRIYCVYCGIFIDHKTGITTETIVSFEFPPLLTICVHVYMGDIDNGNVSHVNIKSKQFVFSTRSLIFFLVKSWDKHTHTCAHTYYPSEVYWKKNTTTTKKVRRRKRLYYWLKCYLD